MQPTWYPYEINVEKRAKPDEKNRGHMLKQPFMKLNFLRRGFLSQKLWFLRNKQSMVENIYGYTVV
jgi:hypothetical protein